MYCQCTLTLMSTWKFCHTFPEIYPECVIASWDTLVFLLDAWHVEHRVQLDAEKKLNVYANYERQEKHANGLFLKEIEHSHFSQRRNHQAP